MRSVELSFPRDSGRPGSSNVSFVETNERQSGSIEPLSLSRFDPPERFSVGPHWDLTRSILFFRSFARSFVRSFARLGTARHGTRIVGRECKQEDRRADRACLCREIPLS